jgi:hypothetical protein
MKAESFRVDDINKFSVAIENKLDAGFDPKLAIVFTSFYNSINEIQSAFTKQGIEVFGVSSFMEFIDGDHLGDSIVVMLLDIKKSDFEVALLETESGKEFETGVAIGESGLDSYTNPSFIVSGSNIKSNGEMIIKGFEEACGKKVSLFGGMAGFKHGDKIDNFVFTNDKMSYFGIISLILNADKIELLGIASCGWQGIGTLKTVTKSNGPWVHTIDNEPALSVLAKYMGIDNRAEGEFDALTEIAPNYPLQLFRDDGSHIMRAPMFGNWKDQSFFCAGTVPEGSKIKFTLPADFEVINKVIGECTTIRDEKIPEADAVLVFSCGGRYHAFGPLVQSEIQGIKDVWNAPMAGLFCMGEFGRTMKGSQEFHNITCSWVALKEK